MVEVFGGNYLSLMSNKIPSLGLLLQLRFLVKQCSSSEAGEVYSLLKRYKYSNILWHH